MLSHINGITKKDGRAVQFQKFHLGFGFVFQEAERTFVWYSLKSF